MTQTNTIMMMKGFTLVSEVFFAVLAALVVTAVTAVTVVLAVSTAIIAAVAVVVEVVVAVAVAVVEAVVVTVIVVAAEVAAEADRISFVKNYGKPLHLGVEAILIKNKHKGQFTVHKMLVMYIETHW
ncbi:hypothetical protein A6K24_22940 [Metabacillus litoralis]|uniref:Uncharacterized protein n=1 Tax=Metabacillus litoralis TaxID=152268 RepID=A0A179T0C8_9BACI|nr:hypothetical protein A6K24_22940 [Metabacillus litoralis]